MVARVTLAEIDTVRESVGGAVDLFEEAVVPELRAPGPRARIVVGLMLGSAIITAALDTGDTMSQTIRSSATSALGRTDGGGAAPGVGAALATGGDATDARYFPEEYANEIALA